MASRAFLRRLAQLSNANQARSSLPRNSHFQLCDVNNTPRPTNQHPSVRINQRAQGQVATNQQVVAANRLTDAQAYANEVEEIIFNMQWRI